MPWSCPKHCSSVFQAAPFFSHFFIFSIFLFSFFFCSFKKNKIRAYNPDIARGCPEMAINGPYQHKNRGQKFLLTGQATSQGSSMAWGGAALMRLMVFNCLLPLLPPSTPFMLVCMGNKLAKNTEIKKGSPAPELAALISTKIAVIGSTKDGHMSMHGCRLSLSNGRVWIPSIRANSQLLCGMRSSCEELAVLDLCLRKSLVHD